MKYSLLMPYFDRAKQFRNTISCFRHFYSVRDDWEIVLIEDLKNKQNQEMHDDLMAIVDAARDLKITVIEYEQEECYNPAEMFNIAASRASGEFLVLTNPEILHETDILSVYDKRLEVNREQYIVCRCKSIINVNDFERFEDLSFDIDPKHNWYVHPRWHRRYLHFCSVIAKNLYEKIGGFDEKYTKGIAYEDGDFVKKIQSHQIPISITQEVVMHQSHDRAYYLDPDLWREMESLNRKYFLSKWG